MTKYIVMRLYMSYETMHIDLWNYENNMGVEMSLRGYRSLFNLLRHYKMLSEPITIEAIMYLYKECVKNGHI